MQVMATAAARPGADSNQVVARPRAHLRELGAAGRFQCHQRRDAPEAGAIRMARDLGPGHTIVTILCDYGSRYQSKLYNPAFLKDKGLPVPDWLDRPPHDIPAVYEDA
jgi:hypothetical protein